MDSRRAIHFTQNIDNFLLPLSGGFLTVLIAVQCITVWPPVRQMVDKVEGRFLVFPSAAAYVQQLQKSATIQLFMASSGNAAPVQVSVLVNGRLRGIMEGGPVSVSVHNGDKIVLYAPALKQTVGITVNHNNPAILTPAPGETVLLSPASNRVTLSTVKFLN